MSVPTQINDGDWTQRTPQSIEYDFPFSEVGDNQTFKARATYRMDKTAYRPLASMSIANLPNFGIAYLTKLGETKDIGCGLYEFVDEFSSVPVTRIEYGSFTFTSQWWEATTASNVDPDKYFYDVTIDIEEQTFTIPAYYKYEYFLNVAPDPLLKSRIFLLFGKPFFIGSLPAYGRDIIADDSQVKIYAGKIFERKTPFVNLNYNKFS